MDLSVVISAYSLDRYDDLTSVLNGLKKQTYKYFETIVVIDENKELINKINEYIEANGIKNTTLIFNPKNRGLSYSRNVGIKNTSGSIVAFIDDDATPADDWVKNIIDTFLENESIGAVTGDVVPLWENESMAWFPKELYWMISCSYVMTPTMKTEVERGFGTNMAFRRAIFDKIGCFDTYLGINGKKWIGGEDTAMFLKIKSANFKVIFNPKIRVQHKIYLSRLNPRNIAKRSFNGGYSVALMKKGIKYKLQGSTENEYLKYIFFTSSQKYLINFIKSPSKIVFYQMISICVVLFFESSGYFFGSLQNNLLKLG
jgi:glycosyltransferase involved in cell wall biosynthesis